MSQLIPRPRSAKAIYGQQHTVEASSATNVACQYVVTELKAASASDKDAISTITLNCNRHLAYIGDFAIKGTTTLAQGSAVTQDTDMDTDIRFKVRVRSHVQYAMRNQSTDLIQVRAYYCKCRQDTNLFNFVSGTTNSWSIKNHYQTLASGFAQNGLNPGDSAPQTNDAMVNRLLTPYQSLLFTQTFKIFKKKAVTLYPGRIARFAVKSKPFLFRPAKYFYMTGSTVYTSFVNAYPTYNNPRYEKFILFQVCSVPTGTGSSQANYSKDIGENTPTILLESSFHYKYNYVHHFARAATVFETSGITTTGGALNSLINVETGELDEEKDAV